MARVQGTTTASPVDHSITCTPRMHGSIKLTRPACRRTNPTGHPYGAVRAACLSMRSLWPAARSAPSSPQGPPPSSANTPALPVNTNAPVPSQLASAARICVGPNQPITGDSAADMTPQYASFDQISSEALPCCLSWTQAPSVSEYTKKMNMGGMQKGVAVLEGNCT